MTNLLDVVVTDSSLRPSFLHMITNALSITVAYIAMMMVVVIYIYMYIYIGTIRLSITHVAFLPYMYIVCCWHARRPVQHTDVKRVTFVPNLLNDDIRVSKKTQGIKWFPPLLVVDFEGVGDMEWHIYGC